MATTTDERAYLRGLMHGTIVTTVLAVKFIALVYHWARQGGPDACR